MQAELLFKTRGRGQVSMVHQNLKAGGLQGPGNKKTAGGTKGEREGTPPHAPLPLTHHTTPWEGTAPNNGRRLLNFSWVTLKLVVNRCVGLSVTDCHILLLRAGRAAFLSGGWQLWQLQAPVYPPPHHPPTPTPEVVQNSFQLHNFIQASALA